MTDIVQGLLDRSIQAAVPLALATLGEVITEKSGVLNLGIEGTMAASAAAGFAAAFATGVPELGLIAGLGTGAFFSLLHALLSVPLKANQTVSGLALTMAGVGLASLWGQPFIGKPLGADPSLFAIPLLSNLPLIGVLFSGTIFYWLTWAAFAAAFILHKSRLGLVLEACGETPKAAEAAGISVGAVRILATTIGGALTGAAGAFLAVDYGGSWNEGLVGGRGWIAVALTIFALWRPGRALWSAWLFGFIFTAQFTLQPFGISPNFLAALPYAFTLAVLIVEGLRRGTQGSKAPGSLGMPFTSGER